VKQRGSVTNIIPHWRPRGSLRVAARRY
jgi:hypothetical protein